MKRSTADPRNSYHSDANMRGSAHSFSQMRSISMASNQRGPAATSIGHRTNSSMIHFLKHDLLHDCMAYNQINNKVEGKARNIALLENKIEHLNDVIKRFDQEENRKEYQTEYVKKLEKREKYHKIINDLEEENMKRKQPNQCMRQTQVDFLKSCDLIAYQKAVEIIQKDNNQVFIKESKDWKTVQTDNFTKAQYNKAKSLIEEGIKRHDKNLKEQIKNKKELKRTKKKLTLEVRKILKSRSKLNRIGIYKNNDIRTLDKELEGLREKIKLLKEQRPKPWEDCPLILPKDPNPIKQIFHVANINSRETYVSNQAVFEDPTNMNIADDAGVAYQDGTGEYGDTLDSQEEYEEGSEYNDQMNYEEGEEIKDNTNDQPDFINVKSYDTYDGADGEGMQ